MASTGTASVDIVANLGNVQRQVSDGLRGISRTLSTEFSGLAGPAVTVMHDIGAAAQTAALAVGAIGVAAVVAATRFNEAISAVGAVSNATAVELERLSEAALQAGADTVFSATESAEAEAELARAGVSVEEILGGALTGSLSLAAAGQLDLADAATIAAQAMNVFNLGGEDVAHVADVLAAGANTSATDVSQLGIAMRQAGLMASQTGLDLEDTVGVLALFADNALIGSDAGTSLRTMLQRLNPQSDEAAGLMEELGITAFDASGEFVGLEAYAQRLQDGLSGLTTEQRNTALTTIFGADAVRAASLLYDAGAEGIAHYTAAVDDQGAAARVAAQMLDNLAGDLEQFQGSTETALIRTGNLFDALLRTVVQSGTGIVNVFNDWAETSIFDDLTDRISGLSESIEGLADMVAEHLRDALGDIDSDQIDDFVDGLSGMKDALEPIAPLAIGIGLAFSTMALRSIPLIGGFLPVISPLTGALAGLMLGSQEGRDALHFLGDELRNIGETVIPPVAAALGELLPSVAQTFGEVLHELMPSIAELAQALSELAVGVLPALADTFAAVAPAVAGILASGIDLLGPILRAIGDHAETLVPLALGLAIAWKGWLIAAAVAKGVVALNLALTTMGAGSAATGLGVWLGTTGLQLAALGAAVGVAALLIGSFVGGQREAAEAARDFASALRDSNVAVGDAVREAALKRLEDQGQVDDLDRLNLTLDEYTNLLLAGASGAEELRRRAVEMNEVVFRDATEGWDLTGAALAEAQRAYIETGETLPMLSGGIRAVIDDNTGLAESFDASQEALQNEVEGQLQAAVVRGQLTDATREQILQQNTANDETTDWVGVLQDLRQVTGDTADAQGDLQRSTYDVAYEFDRAEAAASAYRDVLGDLTSTTVNAEQARLRAIETVQELSGALDEESKSLDENTVAGRTNRQTLIDAITGANELGDAILRQGGSFDEAEAAVNGQVAAVQDAAVAAGVTTDEVLELTDAIDMTPEDVAIRIDLAEDQAAVARIQALRDAIFELPPDVRTEIEALIDAEAYDLAEIKLATLSEDREMQLAVSGVMNPGFIPDGVINAASNEITSDPAWAQIGTNIMQGIAGGVTAAQATLNAAMTTSLGQALDSAKAYAGISSPSTRFAIEIGEPIPEGVAKGILDAADAPLSAVAELMSRIADQAREDLQGVFSGISAALGNLSGGDAVSDAEQAVTDLRNEEQGLGQQIADAWMAMGSGTPEENAETAQLLADLLQRQGEIPGEILAAERRIREARLSLVQSQQRLIESGEQLIGQEGAGTDEFRRVSGMAGLTPTEIEDLLRFLATAIGAASRDLGGPVDQGIPYWIGPPGGIRELFVPDHSGHLYTEGQVAGASQPGRSYEVTQHISGPNAREVAAQVVTLLHWDELLSGDI